MYFKLHALVHIFFLCVVGILLKDKLDKFVINYLTMLVVCTLMWVFYPYENFDQIKSN
jgi:Mn2+/Fe2+ NRAMP family transporter